MAIQSMRNIILVRIQVMPVHTKYVSIELTYALRRCVIAPAHWGVPHRIPHGVRCSIISRAFFFATHWSSTNITPNLHNYLYPDVRQNRSLRKPSPVHPPVRARRTSPCAGVLVIQHPSPVSSLHSVISSQYSFEILPPRHSNISGYHCRGKDNNG